MASYGLTTATVFLDHLVPRQEPVERVVPTTALAEPVSPRGSASSLQQDHASSSFTHFPDAPGCAGFINGRITNDGRTLELRWLSLVQPAAHGDASLADEDQAYEQLDSLGCVVPTRLHFSDPIIATPGLHTSPDDGTLTITLVTGQATIYRLQFQTPELFCLPQDVPLPDRWATDHEAEALLGRTPLLTHAVDADHLLVACADGGLTLLRWGRLVGLSESYGWTSANLSAASSGWWPRFLSAPSSIGLTTSDAAGNQLHASADAAIAVASSLGDGGTGDDGWAFTLGRDRKLRIWSLATFACVAVRNLIRSDAAESALVPQSETSAKKQQTTPLLPAIPRSLLRYVPADEGDDSTYEGFLVAFVPSAVSPVFVSYGLTVSRDRRNVDLVLLEERECAELWGTPDGMSTVEQGELRDFRVAKVDPATDPEAPPDQRAWTLWTVWNEPGGEMALRYVPLFETRAWQQATTPDPPGWRKIIASRSRGSEGDWDPAYFDDALADESKTVPEFFLEHILRPGRYSPSTLKYALETYSEPLYHDRSNNRSAAVDASYDSLEEKVAAVVGSTVRLETSPQTGAPLYDAFRKRLHGEWLRFAAMCEESRRSALWPVEIAVDGDRQVALVFGRNCVVAPLATETSLAVAEAAQELAEGRVPVLPAAATSFYQALGDDAESADVVRLVSSAAALAERLPREVLQMLESDLSEFVKTPTTVSFDDVATSFAAGPLGAALEESREALDSDLLDALGDLGGTLRRIWTVITSSELLRPPAQLDVEAASVLTQAFVADSVLTIVDARFRIARDTILLLLVLASDGPGVRALPTSELSTLLSAFLATFHSLAVLRWLGRQGATAIETEQGVGFGDETTLMDRFSGLQMGDQTAADIDGARSSAFSLLTSLMATKYQPGFSIASPPDLSVTYAASSFLGALGVPAHKRQVVTTLNDVLLVEQLLKMGLPSIAVQVIAMYPGNPGMRYLDGAALLATGRIEDAEDAFRQAASALYESTGRLDDDACLVQLLPMDCPSTVPAYFHHVASLFDSAGADLAVAHFADLALSAVDDPVGRALPQHTTEELWTKLFQANLALGLYEDAYKAMVHMPSDELKHTCLQQLVQSMCEGGEVDYLLRLPFGSLQGKLHEALSWRARNSDPRSSPNYFGILYSYNTARGDYRSAGTAMYQRGRKLADLQHLGNPSDLWIQQCYSYLSAINALSLLPSREAWIPMPARHLPGDQGSRKRRRVTYHVPTSELSAVSEDLEVMTLDDIRQEYAKVLARLELIGALPHLAERALADLDGEAAVPLLLGQGRVEAAFEKALALGVDMTGIFTSLAEACTRVARDGVKAVAVDQEWIYQSHDAATWEGSLASLGWRLLQLHLDRHDTERTHWRYHEAVVNAILSTDRNVKLPPWLLTFFMDHCPGYLLSAFFRFDLLEDAFAVAITIISKADSRLPTSLTRGAHPAETWLPLALFDQLLALTPGHVDAAAISLSRLDEHQAELRKALDYRQSLVKKADGTLRRQLAGR